MKPIEYLIETSKNPVQGAQLNSRHYQLVSGETANDVDPYKNFCCPNKQIIQPVQLKHNLEYNIYGTVN